MDVVVIAKFNKDDHEEIIKNRSLSLQTIEVFLDL
jgi:hypothetical protein